MEYFTYMNRYNSYVNILNRYILVCLKEELINNILFIYLFFLGFFFFVLQFLIEFGWNRLRFEQLRTLKLFTASAWFYFFRVFNELPLRLTILEWASATLLVLQNAWLTVVPFQGPSELTVETGQKVEFMREMKGGMTQVKVGERCGLIPTACIRMGTTTYL